MLLNRHLNGPDHGWSHPITATSPRPHRCL